MNYDFDYTKHNIYTPFILSFNPTDFMIDFNNNILKNQLPTTAVL